MIGDYDMSKKSSWRGLNELVDAKEAAKEMLRAIESLHKEHRTFDAKTIKKYSDRLSNDVDETSARLQEKFRQIVEDLESHKQRIAAMRNFLERHYELKKPRKSA
jgi:gas vesicle protein